MVSYTGVRSQQRPSAERRSGAGFDGCTTYEESRGGRAGRRQVSPFSPVGCSPSGRAPTRYEAAAPLRATPQALPVLSVTGRMRFDRRRCMSTSGPGAAARRHIYRSGVIGRANPRLRAGVEELGEQVDRHALTAGRDSQRSFGQSPPADLQVSHRPADAQRIRDQGASASSARSAGSKTKPS